MKKKILSFILAICLIIPCGFMLSACGNNNCDHSHASITKLPTLEETGEFYCHNCKKTITLPILNTSDYTKNDNPDYVVYTYTLGEHDRFDIVEHSNFEIDTYNDGLQYKIVKYIGNNTSVTIPDYVCTYEWFGKGYNIIPCAIEAIEDDAFKDNTDLEELMIPDGVECGNSLLNGCTSLKKLTIPSRGGNFYELFGTSVDDVPDSLKEVVLTMAKGGAFHFDNCDKIEKITYIKGNLGSYNNCTSLKEITVSLYTTTIRTNTFNNCFSLTDIVVPASVTDITIQSGALKDCSNANIYYLGSKSNISVNDEGESIKMIYYYSDIAPSGVEYLNNKKIVDTWHYNASEEKLLWQPNFTTNVDAKTFNYSNSIFECSDTYWAMLKEAERQGILGDLFDGDQARIDDVTSSSTKEEYESKMVTYYASTATATSVSFANDKLTLNTSAGSGQLDYIEVDSEVCCKVYGTSKVYFTYNNGTIYEELSTEHYTIRHIYTLSE